MYLQVVLASCCFDHRLMLQKDAEAPPSVQGGPAAGPQDLVSSSVLDLQHRPWLASARSCSHTARGAPRKLLLDHLSVLQGDAQVTLSVQKGHRLVHKTLLLYKALPGGTTRPWLRLALALVEAAAIHGCLQPDGTYDHAAGRC